MDEAARSSDLEFAMNDDHQIVSEPTMDEENMGDFDNSMAKGKVLNSVNVIYTRRENPLSLSAGISGMEPKAEADCVLKVDVQCDECKMKLMEVLSSISGVYSVTIDAEQGIAKVAGEVEPNAL
nr:heavy metal-associated isoprenylated plant protein 32-like [Ipomoea batatas]